MGREISERERDRAIAARVPPWRRCLDQAETLGESYAGSEALTERDAVLFAAEAIRRGWRVFAVREPAK
jgi:NADH/NAD ratio-sensing transcriptional regulator Rex